MTACYKSCGMNWHQKLDKPYQAGIARGTAPIAHQERADNHTVFYVSMLIASQPAPPQQSSTCPTVTAAAAESELHGSVVLAQQSSSSSSPKTGTTASNTITMVVTYSASLRNLWLDGASSDAAADATMTASANPMGLERIFFMFLQAPELSAACGLQLLWRWKCIWYWWR
ncbi:hypothetical protein ACA910_021818 [Epithemia clementina (nom. ined.)]